MHHLEQELDRNQFTSIALEQLVAKDSWVRVVDLFVDALPMKELGFEHIEHETQGRPPYHPTVLLKLYMYGYRHGIRSASKLYHACMVNVELWWLLKGLKPSERTILYFRKNNSKAFKKAFQHLVLIQKEWGLIDGETIAIDSFKIRAQNSSKNNFNQKKIDLHKDYIEGKINEYLEALETEDSVEKRVIIESKIAHQKKNKIKFNALEKELIDSGESQISKTDPDARKVILHKNIINVGYNIQAGCDSKYKLFINAQTGSVNDVYALSPMAIEAKELLGLEQMNVLADKGYTTGKEINTCTKHNITTFSCPKEHSSQKNGLYNMETFVYDAEKDTYTCPAGETLNTNGSIYKKKSHRVKHYKTKKCKGCEARDFCTENKNGRTIERGIYQEDLEQNEKRVNQNPNYYRERQQITEHQFGTLKRQWGFTYTLMKGKENVLSEVHLCFSVYNLLRMVQLFGIDELKKRLKSLTLFFWSYIATFKTQYETLFFQLPNSCLILTTLRTT